MAALKVRKEMLDTEIHIDINGSSVKVVLATASQEQLRMLHEKGVDVFEKKEEK